jgi:hypothetical protein
MVNNELKNSIEIYHSDTFVKGDNSNTILDRRQKAIRGIDGIDGITN